MAESKGFEPLVGSLLHFFSKEALSTTQPTLLGANSERNEHRQSHVTCVNDSYNPRVETVNSIFLNFFVFCGSFLIARK